MWSDIDRSGAQGHDGLIARRRFRGAGCLIRAPGELAIRYDAVSHPGGNDPGNQRPAELVIGTSGPPDFDRCARFCRAAFRHSDRTTPAGAQGYRQQGVIASWPLPPSSPPNTSASAHPQPSSEPRTFSSAFRPHSMMWPLERQQVFRRSATERCHYLLMPAVGEGQGTRAL